MKRRRWKRGIVPCPECGRWMRWELATRWFVGRRVVRLHAACSLRILKGERKH